jgi:CheY-like chemotaxis protein
VHTPRKQHTLKPHVLIVDDALSTRRAIAALLASEGYTVSTAQDGLDALEQLQLQTPDLIISDLNMPRMSGIELLKVVRHRFPEIALIASSGDYEDDRTPDGLVADAFYAKSSHQPKDLLRTVAKLTSTNLLSLSSY